VVLAAVAQDGHALQHASGDNADSIM
jgi:hypothetical protein